MADGHPAGTPVATRSDPRGATHLVASAPGRSDVTIRQPIPASVRAQLEPRPDWPG